MEHNPTHKWFREFPDYIIYEAYANDRNHILNGTFARVFATQAHLEDVQLTPKKKFIFDCCNEGIGPREIAAISASLQRAKIELDYRVLFNSYVTAKLPYKYACFPGHFVQHCNFVNHVQTLNIDWESIQIDTYFISLMRRPSLERVQFAKQILDTFPKDQFLLSCGSQPNEWSEVPTDLKKAISPYTLPVLLDGFTDDYQDQHFHIDTNFFSCFINLIVESSSQADIASWDEIFITEKTLKAFAYRQIPMWFAVPKTVCVVRELGFDVFDDIIDHSYDTIYDPAERMNILLTVLYDFINKNTLNDVALLRKSIWNRLDSNFRLLHKLSKEHPTTTQQYINELIK